MSSYHTQLTLSAKNAINDYAMWLECHGVDNDHSYEIAYDTFTDQVDSVMKGIHPEVDSSDTVVVNFINAAITEANRRIKVDINNKYSHRQVTTLDQYLVENYM